MQRQITISSIVALFILSGSVCLAAPPVLAVSPTYMEFTAYEGGANPDPNILSIWRDGGNGPLDWQVIESCSWLTVAPTSGKSSGEIDDCNVSVDIAGLTGGLYNCQLTVDAGTATNSPQIVDINLTVIGPGLQISQTYFEFFAVEGKASPNDQILTIDNSGGGTLNWSITEDCNWLTVEPNSGNSTGEADNVNLSVDISGLAQGLYECNLIVSAPYAANNPQTFVVTLDICPHIEGALYVPLEYPTIQAAINDANDGDIVIVADGVYTGTGNRDIDFLGKSTMVRSENGPKNCIIDCQSDPNNIHRAFIFDSNEDANSVLAGFTITNGYSTNYGGGIYCSSSSPTITNCLIIGNTAGMTGGGIHCSSGSNATIFNCSISNNTAHGGSTVCNGGGICLLDSSPTINNCIISGNSAIGSPHPGNPAEGGGGIFCKQSFSTITNCTITNNTTEKGGGGIHCAGGSDVGLNNSILWNNTALQGHEIYLSKRMYPSPSPYTPSKLTISYSDIEGGQSDVIVEPDCNLIYSPNNKDGDPCFVDADSNDYHLQSQAGRWDANSESWVTDANTSVAIDAGDPNSDWTAELWPHGKRINMGAYGGTAEASMSLSNLGNIANLNNDANDIVDYNDLALFVDKWLYQQVLLAEDLDRDGSVNIVDYVIFADGWLNQ